MQRISIVIPVYNDKGSLQTLLKHLKWAFNPELLEVIVVDGGSTDNVEQIIPAQVKFLQNSKACRAAQMNHGARYAAGEILYFVHADCLPPLTLVPDINKALEQGHTVGCYRLKLTPSNWLLELNSYFSRFKTVFSGGGDQTLYLPKQLFEEAGGFNEDFSVMEDFELVHRLMPKYGYHIMPKDVINSSRKYDQNSYLRVNWANYRAFRMYRQRVPAHIIKERYYGWLNPVK